VPPLVILVCLHHAGPHNGLLRAPLKTSRSNRENNIIARGLQAVTRVSVVPKKINKARPTTTHSVSKVKWAARRMMNAMGINDKEFMRLHRQRCARLFR
jgi:hypothetical protein